LVAVKTNIQILYYVTGAQEICCNLKLCNSHINSSAFMQNTVHIFLFAAIRETILSFQTTQCVTKHRVYKTLHTHTHTHTRYP